MAKIEKASEDIIKFFDDLRDKTTIPQWIQFEILCNNKQKELYKIVKSNDIVEVLTDGVNFAVVINEEIFDKLPADMQEIAIAECLGGVAVNDKDVVSLEKPDFITRTGVLQKYGDTAVIRFKESVKSLYDKKKQDEEEAKAASKAKKSKKKI